jgi:heme/copper-type cytochrome/quinol oxidase subunit 2
MSAKKCVKACVLLLSRAVSSLLPFGAAIAILLSPLPGFAQQAAVSEPKVFEIVARRFSFEPATVEVIEGDTVRLLVRSADGPHGVEIKAFKVKKAVPRAKEGDSPVTIEFVAKAAGEYPILCSEYCGNGHKDMTGTLIVRAKPKGDQ